MSAQKRNIFKIRTRLQQKLMLSIFFAMLFPTLIFGGALYFMFDKVLSCGKNSSFQFELCVMQLTPVLLILFMVFIIFFMIYALLITNRFAGPVERLSSDLDGILNGDKKGPLSIRPKDDLKPLVDNINVLLEKSGHL